MRPRWSVAWRHEYGTKGLIMVPHSRNAMTTQTSFDADVNLYGSAPGFSERTNHNPCGCVASTEGYHFWEAHVRPSRWTQGGSVKTLLCVA